METTYWKKKSMEENVSEKNLVVRCIQTVVTDWGKHNIKFK